MTNTATARPLVIARPGDMHAIDEISPTDGRTVWGNLSIEEATQKHPGARVMTYAEWMPLEEAAEVAHYCKQPEEVDRERFRQLLEVLPPMNWQGVGRAHESFMLGEPMTDTLRLCVVRIGDRYAEMIRHKTTTHAQLCDEVRAFLQA